jgi:hypothetical protein
VYDGKKREPTYANAHRSCLWEMVSDKMIATIVEPELTA